MMLNSQKESNYYVVRSFKSLLSRICSWVVSLLLWNLDRSEDLQHHNLLASSYLPCSFKYRRNGDIKPDTPREGTEGSHANLFCNAMGQGEQGRRLVRQCLHKWLCKIFHILQQLFANLTDLLNISQLSLRMSLKICFSCVTSQAEDKPPNQKQTNKLLIFLEFGWSTGRK